jgi:hypothetical protein
MFSAESGRAMATKALQVKAERNCSHSPPGKDVQRKEYDLKNEDRIVRSMGRS